MNRKRIQFSFAHTQPVTAAQNPGSPESASMAIVIDVDLSGESFRLPRSRRRKEADRINVPADPPPHIGGYQFRRKRKISVKTNAHTICIFYRHGL